MKAMILNDLYILKGMIKKMVFVLIVFAVCMIPSIGIYGVVAVFSFMSSLMVINIFSYDEHSHWPQFALTMPLTRRDYVMGKYATNLIMSVGGGVLGIVVAAAGAFIMKMIKAGSVTAGGAGLSENTFQFGEVFLTFVVSVLTAMFLSFLYVPLIIRLGTVVGRYTSIIAGGAIVGLFVTLFGKASIGEENFAMWLGNSLSESPILTSIMCIIGALAVTFVLWMISYKLSLRWMKRKS